MNESKEQRDWTTCIETLQIIARHRALVPRDDEKQFWTLIQKLYKRFRKEQIKLIAGTTAVFSREKTGNYHTLPFGLADWHNCVSLLQAWQDDSTEIGSVYCERRLGKIENQIYDIYKSYRRSKHPKKKLPFKYDFSKGGFSKEDWQTCLQMLQQIGRKRTGIQDRDSLVRLVVTIKTLRLDDAPSHLFEKIVSAQHVLDAFAGKPEVALDIQTLKGLLTRIVRKMDKEMMVGTPLKQKKKAEWNTLDFEPVRFPNLFERPPPPRRPTPVTPSVWQRLLRLFWS